MSKSFSGRASTSVAIIAIIKLCKIFIVTKNVEIKTATKQVKLPTIVLLGISFSDFFPKHFPAKLERPSPNASAKIPMLAVFSGNISNVAITPIARVTGPKTNLPLSRSRDASLVTVENKNIFFPCILKNSKIVYKSVTSDKKIIVSLKKYFANNGTNAEDMCMLFRKASFNIISTFSF